MVDYFRTNYNEDKIGFEDEEDDEVIEKRLKEENYYKYHENVSQYDPKGQPYSYFYITVMG